MTAPGKPLVDVIAQVLNEHQPAGPPFRDLRPRCACGDWVGSELAMYTERTAHQARAVLAAISEAGAVEWGWEYRGLIGGKYDRRITRNWTADRALTREEVQSEVDNMNSRHPNIARLIHRTATAWTAVEG